ncbi:hypothetical protein N7488_011670 [Penicillium malachiteum]|nr:hypothetical protein N7488_011670 [Penicillium malachiteum]
MDLSTLDGPPLLDQKSAQHVTSTPILVDYSSLDGPRISDWMTFTPDPTLPRIHQERPTPQSEAHYYILSKPLPPRPASADPQIPRELRRKPVPPLDTTRSTTEEVVPENTANLRRAPARRGRISPKEELILVEEYLNENSVRPTGSNWHTLTAPSPRRSHTEPIMWLEEEGLWEVPCRWPSRTSLPTLRSPSRSSMSTAFSAIPDGWFHQHGLPVTSDTVRVHIDSALGEAPPSYDSHAFSSAYFMRKQDGPLPEWSPVSPLSPNVSAI